MHTTNVFSFTKILLSWYVWFLLIFSFVAAILGFPALVGVHAHTHIHPLTLTRVHQNIIPHVFYYMVFVNLACKKFSELPYSIVESIVMFQRCSHLFWQPFCTFKEQQYSLLAEVSSPLSAVTGTWRSSVPHNWYNAILTGFFFQGPNR